MAQNISVPDIGDFKDVEVIEVLVKPGDKVNKNDPIVTIGSFLFTLSPGLTRTSITSTSLKSPISGTEIFWAIITYYKLVGTY